MRDIRLWSRKLDAHWRLRANVFSAIAPSVFRLVALVAILNETAHLFVPISLEVREACSATLYARRRLTAAEHRLLAVSDALATCFATRLRVLEALAEVGCGPGLLQRLAATRVATEFRECLDLIFVRGRLLLPTRR